MWRVSSSDGTRWVQQDDDGRVDAQPVGLVAIVCDPAPTEIAPMTGQWYTPSGESDPVAVFLRARTIVGGGVRVAGVPPRVPAVAGGAPARPGIVF